MLPVAVPREEVGTLVPEAPLETSEPRRPARSTIGRLAVVNRGESALRCIRTVRALRARDRSVLEAVALYDDLELHAPFVRYAHSAVRLPERGIGSTAWGNHDALFEALGRARADAIWPGWGLVARDPEFAERAVAEGFNFVGPSARSIRLFADHAGARDLAESVDVATVEPGAVEGRHIAVPVIADRHGSILALCCGERSAAHHAEGGIEESPPPGLGVRTLRAICDAAVRVARAGDYIGVGTVRFVFAAGVPYFIELCAELPPEHGVTEAVTGLDLVELQLRVACGESVAAVRTAGRGVAIGVCLRALPSDAPSAPASGVVARFEPALGTGIRLDCGVTVGASIWPEVDSHIASLIATGETRADACGRLSAALESTELVVQGCATNHAPLLAKLRSRAFCPNERGAGPEAIDAAPEALAVASLLLYRQEFEAERRRLFSEGRCSAATAPPPRARRVDLTVDGICRSLDVSEVADSRYRISLDGHSTVVTWHASDAYSGRLLASERTWRVVHYHARETLSVEIGGVAYRFGLRGAGEVRAALLALVTAVHVEAGQVVQTGEPIAVLEAMKTEIVLRAPMGGIITSVDIRVGGQVKPGDRVIRIEPESQAGHASPRRGLRDERPRPSTTLGRREELRNALLGFDVDPARTAGILDWLKGATGKRPSDDEGASMARLSEEVVLFADLEGLFCRLPRLDARGHGQPSNRERLWESVAHLAAGREAIGSFAVALRRALRHYDVTDLQPSPGLQRAVLRLLCTAESRALRCELIEAVLHRLSRLRSARPELRRDTGLKDALDSIAELRGLVGDALAHAAFQLSHSVFEAPRLRRRAARPPSVPDGDWLETHVRRLDRFVLLKRAVGAPVHCFQAQSRDVPADRRILVFARVRGEAPPDGVLSSRHLASVELALASATRGLFRALDDSGSDARSLRRALTLDVEPPLTLDSSAIDRLVRTVSPATRRLGIESVTLRLRPRQPEHRGKWSPERELVVRTRAGLGVVTGWNDFADRPIEAAGRYEQRVVAAHLRGLPEPYELARLLDGDFQELELETHSGRAASLRPVQRPPGSNECSVVVGLRTTRPTKVPEGLQRIVILSDPSHSMGAITPPECRRIVAALDLAEQRRLPVEWAPISSGARIAMDSGTENLDAIAMVVQRIVRFTQAGGVIHIVVSGVNVGGQSYWNALSTMLLHTRGVLVMTAAGSMVLTGRAGLGASGSATAEDEVAIGGFERIAGPNGQAQYYAPDLRAGFRLLDEFYRYSYVVPGEKSARRHRTGDPDDRDVTTFPYRGPAADGFKTVGEIFDDAANPGRKRPFAMRAVMESVIDQDGGKLERWRYWKGAETAIVWDAHLGGIPVCLVGIEGKSIPREEPRPADGPAEWSGGTLFPQTSRKIARALNAASRNRPVVLLAHLAGFDGSPESLRSRQLENGAEIARAVVNFDGPIVFLVVSRYHGGAYVVFSRELNPSVRVAALHGSYASVIGGNVAATVVFGRDARRRAAASRQVAQQSEMIAGHRENGSALDCTEEVARVRAEREIAAEFDAVHTIGRAQEVGSIRDLVPPSEMRAYLTGALKEALGEDRP